MNNGKVRIYELSRDLNLDNKDILGICDRLNIAVKSHSSTITESQAERIRAVAEQQVGQEASDGNASLGDGNSQGSRKQQILEIRSRGNQQQSGEESTQASLAAPPRPPARPQTPSPKPQVVDSKPLPPKPIPQPKSTNGAEAETQRSFDADADFQAPELIGPPKRPSSPAPKPDRPRKDEPSAPRLIRKPEVAASPERPAGSQPKPVAPVAKEAKAEIEQKPRPKPELKAPPKIKRPQKAEEEISEPISDGADDIDSPDLDGEDDVEVLELKEKPKLKLKRPTPAHPKKQEWEEDDDEEGRAKAKAAAKPKRRKPILEEDDEEVLASELDNAGASMIVSQSIARPPKPMVDRGPRPAAASPQKPVPKSEKVERSTSNRSDNRRREKAVVPEKPEKIVLSGNLTVRELADLLQITETEIIRKLFFKGIAVNITQSLDLQIAQTVAEELGVEVEIPEKTSAATKVTEMLDNADLEKLQPRPPVVTIMGHVDHGKTTLLDSIRKTKVAQGEAGGITQHIGAYHVDVEHNGKNQQVVFLDTPGHEAFTAMRARGTRVTDIAILVVAADDGVQPQTKEAISHARAAEVPIIVAINKVDKPDSEPDRIKQELTEQQLVSEEWGGDTIMVPVSALQGDNLDTLLEMILLVAEIEELSANPDRLARGTVIEAHLDKARGPVATLLVQNGTLRVGDSLVAGSALGKIRAMIDDRGDRVDDATPSFAVEVLGLSEVPSAGDEFEVFPTEKEARAVANSRAVDKREDYLQKTMSSRRVTLSSLSAQAQEGELKELNLILKADVQGSVEAILGSLEQLPQDEVQLRVLLAAPGEVTETDIDLAAASGAVVIGFNTTLASGARPAADREGVDVREYDIIYKLLDDIQGAMEGLLEPEEVEEPLGQAEVRAVFPVGRGAVAGCYVKSGKVIRNRHIRVHRGNEVIYQGILDSLKRMKEDTKEVNAGFECGIGVDKFNAWKEGDTIEAYQMVTKRRTLATR